MSNSIECTSKQNYTRNVAVLTEAFIRCFIGNAFLIDNPFLLTRKVEVKKMKNIER